MAWILAHDSVTGCSRMRNATAERQGHSVSWFVLILCAADACNMSVVHSRFHAAETFNGAAARLLPPWHSMHDCQVRAKHIQI